jgi:DMSO reductase family type II enzyme chaperone
METIQLNEADLALCRSALYEALALGFCPPTQETADRLLTETQNQSLAEIATLLDQKSNGDQSSMSRTVRKLTKSSDASRESLEGSFLHCFGHTAHSKVPAHETEYGAETLFQQPQQLADLSGFLSAFGLKLNLDQRERVDHISCECEFLSFLARKEAYALEENDTDMLEQTRKAQRLFLKDHLGRFAPSFANLLLREASHTFYGTLGELCRKFVLQECARFGIPSGPENLRLRPKVSVDDCLTCGSGEEVIQDMCDSDCNLE